MAALQAMGLKLIGWKLSFSLFSGNYLLRKLFSAFFLILIILVVDSDGMTAQSQRSEQASDAPTGSSPLPSNNGGTLLGRGALTPTELKTLLKEFGRAQKTEIQALEHQQELEKRELKASQNARFKEWRRKEREERKLLMQKHLPFDQLNPKFKDYVQRMKALEKGFDDERAQQLRDHDAQLNALKHVQVEKLREFQDFTQRGERPPQRLWPESHH